MAPGRESGPRGIPTQSEVEAIYERPDSKKLVEMHVQAAAFDKQKSEEHAANRAAAEKKDEGLLAKVRERLSSL